LDDAIVLDLAGGTSYAAGVGEGVGAGVAVGAGVGVGSAVDGGRGEGVALDAPEGAGVLMGRLASATAGGARKGSPTGCALPSNVIAPTDMSPTIATMPAAAVK
jgi:hypothetical protein